MRSEFKDHVSEYIRETNHVDWSVNSFWVNIKKTILKPVVQLVVGQKEAL